MDDYPSDADGWRQGSDARPKDPDARPKGTDDCPKDVDDGHRQVMRWLYADFARFSRLFAPVKLLIVLICS